MNLFLLIIFLVWGIRIIGNVLTYVQLWWVKEYRFDRMVIHLRTPQGKRLFWPTWRRPPIRIKTVLLVLVTLSSLFLFVSRFPTSLFLALFVADLVSFPLTSLFVFFFSIPTWMYHRVFISHAVRKLRLHAPMTVIGITGSYGKTSVKDYLATILSARFKVLKTETSKNSPIGIAEVILRELRPEHEIFVVEMGAYKRGEIAYMSNMVKPQIGIVTAINPQHQDLFGTIENTMHAKYELIKGLTGRKLGIFNGDDERVREMGSWAKRDGVDVKYWSIKDAKDIRADFNGVEFTFKSTHIKAPVLGEHQIGNIIVALIGAEVCGMNLHDATKAVQKIRSAKGVMQEVEGIHGATFIDDSFNNNPDAAEAAVVFLAKAKGRKIFVFQPMIELGQYAQTSHREVGKLAESVCDDIILTNDSFQKEFPSARVLNPKGAAQYLQKTIQKNDTVVFKGKEAGLVLQLCLEK